VTIIQTGLAWSLFSMACSLIFGGLSFHWMLTHPVIRFRLLCASACLIYGALFVLAGRLAFTLGGLL